MKTTIAAMVLTLGVAAGADASSRCVANVPVAVGAEQVFDLCAVELDPGRTEVTVYASREATGVLTVRAVEGAQVAAIARCHLAAGIATACSAAGFDAFGVRPLEEHSLLEGPRVGGASMNATLTAPRAARLELSLATLHTEVNDAPGVATGTFRLVTSTS